MHPIPVLAAVINRDGRYLVCQRPAHKRHGDLWEFPGGKLEPGESLINTANRELTEELGVIALEVSEPLLSIADPGSPFVIEFVPTVISGEPTCLEHAELRWALLAELPELPELPLAPSDRDSSSFSSPAQAGTPVAPEPTAAPWPPGTLGISSRDAFPPTRPLRASPHRVARRGAGSARPPRRP